MNPILQILLVVGGLVAVGAAVYFFVIKKKGSAILGIPAPLLPGWNILYSPNMPAVMPTLQDGLPYLDFPQIDGVHYVTMSHGPVALGQTITMTFSIIGTGTLIATDGGTPPHVRIMLEQANDDLATPDARWWSPPVDLTAQGDFTLTAKVDFNAGWITIGGGLPTQGAVGFANCIAKLGSLGFTFGGWSAGHGIYAHGPVRFVLKSYTVV